MTYRVAFEDAINLVDRNEWQRLVAADNPFVSYDYLDALEQSGATGEGTAWLPHHALVYNENNALVAAAPLYIKEDSWGEFVFDFAWAEAHHRNGIAYYPKLVTAVPYTPVAGPRLLTAGETDETTIAALLKAIKKTVEELHGSSWHILFPDASGLELLAQDPDLIVREDCQFHWHNRGYTSFDHYLEHCRSSRRKKTRRERRKVTEAGILVEALPGHELSPDQWDAFYELYASTFYVRGRAPYFAQSFFTSIARSDLINMRVCFAMRDERTVAASMFFESHDTLYGRYWGTREFVDGLHFELCYYQGIEYCIERKLATFDPGVQGEHKIARGFQASTSWSAHWLRYPPFANAIRNHVKLEQDHVKDYAEQVDLHLPFHKSIKTKP